jgi:hypothetical protein
MAYQLDFDERDDDLDSWSTPIHGPTECRNAGAVTARSKLVAIELGP